MMKDRAALIADKMTTEFVEHKGKFANFEEGNEHFVDGEAICRQASFSMHTREIGSVEFDMVYTPEGTVFMKTQLLEKVRFLDEVAGDPKTLLNGIKSYIDENIAFTDGENLYFTEVEYQDVVAQIALQKQASGGYEPVICSVTPVGTPAPAP